jgi:4'-phosphopantetheinyl transferase
MLLSPSEHERAERFAKDNHRRLWVRAHGALRALLGGYLRLDPRTLRFALGAHGKPTLVGHLPGQPHSAHSAELSPSQLCFNLSHSGARALYAFTYEGPVGVDIEVSRRPSGERTAYGEVRGARPAFDQPARRPVDEVVIAARAFGREKARHLEALEPRVREREFLRAWVRREAALKCLGTGIGVSQTDSSKDDLWVTELDVGSSAAAAVALERPPDELRLWEWPPTDQSWSFDGRV